MAYNGGLSEEELLAAAKQRSLESYTKEQAQQQQRTSAGAFMQYYLDNTYPQAEQMKLSKRLQAAMESGKREEMRAVQALMSRISFKTAVELGGATDAEVRVLIDSSRGRA